jgi:glutaminyl-peptide cyclotransferase
MSKARRITLLVVLILLVGAYFIIPLIDNFSPSQPEDLVEENYANFSFSDNISLKYGDKKKLSFIVSNTEVSKIELVIADSIIKQWMSPKGSISFDLNSIYFPLGAQEVKINIYKNNVLVAEDSRLVRILSDIKPSDINAKVLSLTPHNPTHFTQGLEFYNNQLLESTGQYGESKVMYIDQKTGKAIKQTDVEATCFGEGITVLNNKMYEITWKEQKCFVYDVTTLTLEKTISYTGEGWGLCNDGKNLIMSDGSERIYFRNPITFQIVKTIEVYDQKGPRINLNELEYIDGKIYANVWQENYLLVIDPILGRVEKIIHCEDVIGQARGEGEVLNGIAYNPQTKKVYLTGKNWSKLAEVKL